jgi:hypothetical protein
VRSLAATAGILAYMVRIYFSYFQHEQFTRYPQPIAKSLRRALYYSNYKPDPKLALKYYKLALEQCDEHHLDPFSDDVMGVKIQLAAWLEKIGNYENSAKVLETLLEDCKRWVGAMEKDVKDGAAPRLTKPTTAPEADGQNGPPSNEPSEESETLWGKRTRVLGKAVGISVKLGELYADEHMLREELAHERLIWSVETVLRELRRRNVEGVKEGEGEWMKSEAIGAALECEQFLLPSLQPPGVSRASTPRRLPSPDAAITNADSSQLWVTVTRQSHSFTSRPLSFFKP